MSCFNRDGLTFHYSDAGTGLPVVFQHGLGSDRKQPVSLLPPLPGFRFLSMDFRGHGETRPLGPPDKICMAAFADDLLAWLDFLDVEKAVVGGISMGAAVALKLALQHPDRIHGLMLSRACWLDRPSPPNAEIFVTIGRYIRDFGGPAGRKRFHQSAEFRDLARKSVYFAESLLGLLDDPRSEETAIKYDRIPRDAPVQQLEELSAIRAPTLVMANRRDPIHPFEYGEALVRVIPGATLCEIAPKSDGESLHAADVHRAVAGFLQTTFAQ